MCAYLKIYVCECLFQPEIMAMLRQHHWSDCYFMPFHIYCPLSVFSFGERMSQTMLPSYAFLAYELCSSSIAKKNLSGLFKILFLLIYPHLYLIHFWNLLTKFKDYVVAHTVYQFVPGTPIWNFYISSRDIYLKRLASYLQELWIFARLTLIPFVSMFYLHTWNFIFF